MLLLLLEVLGIKRLIDAAYFPIVNVSLDAKMIFCNTSGVIWLLVEDCISCMLL